MPGVTGLVPGPVERNRFGRISTGRALPFILVGLVLGNWCLGKGFAYAGYFPVFVGDVALLTALVVVLNGGTFARISLNSARLVSAFCFVVALQVPVSIVLQGQPWLAVLRNVAPVYYSVFAYLAFHTLAHMSGPGGLGLSSGVAVDRLLGRAVPWVLVVLTVTVVTGLVLPEALPRWPHVGVSVPFFKPSDAAVPLLVVVVMWFRHRIPLVYLLWALALLLVCASRSRAVLLALAVVVLLVGKPTRRFVVLMAVVVLTVAVLATTGWKVSLGGYREVSGDQLRANAASLLGLESGAQFDPTGQQTTSWRLDWWSLIYRDSLRGAHPAVGLGWGTDLAARYGFSSGDEADVTALRDPHNIAMSLLGRGGWATVALWVAFYATLLREIRKARRAARRSGRNAEVTLLDVSVAVIVGGLVLGFSDVFLESPQNAIPHWIFVGVAWFAVTSVRAVGKLQPATAAVRAPAAEQAG